MLPATSLDFAADVLQEATHDVRVSVLRQMWGRQRSPQESYTG